MGGPYGTAIGVSVRSIKKASVKLLFCLGCEGIIVSDVDNLGPLGSLHRGLRPGAVTSIRYLAFVRGTPVYVGMWVMPFYRFSSLLPVCRTLCINNSVKDKKN